MKKNTGKPYESLTQAVWQAIVDQDFVKNILVEHNVILPGKSKVTHQIDVYWKFAVGDLRYETIVEVKDWTGPVRQGELFQFKAVLDDLPGQPHGIFVSRNGYQEGARSFAFDHGIPIYELREADPPSPVEMVANGWAQLKLVSMPFNGVISMGEKLDPNSLYSVGFEIDVFNPEFSNINTNVSSSWLRSEYPHLDVSTLKKIELLGVSELFDEHGTAVTKFFEVLQKIAQGIVAEGTMAKRGTHVFEKPTFVLNGSPVFPRIKIDSVTVDVKVEHKQEIRRAQMSKFGQWIFRNIKNGNARLFLSAPSVETLMPSKNQFLDHPPNEPSLRCSVKFLVGGKDVNIFADITTPGSGSETKETPHN